MYQLIVLSVIIIIQLIFRLLMKMNSLSLIIKQVYSKKFLINLWTKNLTKLFFLKIKQTFL